MQAAALSIHMDRQKPLRMDHCFPAFITADPLLPASPFQGFQKNGQQFSPGGMAGHTDRQASIAAVCLRSKLKSSPLVGLNMTGDESNVIKFYSPHSIQNDIALAGTTL